MDLIEKTSDLEAKLNLQSIQIKEHEKQMKSNEN